MDNWDEIRTAFQVAKRGTVSGAAEVLGVHHATVIRHIDALEGRLGVKLFQRHARGYTPTEAGSDLLQVAQATDDQFTQLAGRIKGRGHTVTGELVITTLPSMSYKLTPVLAQFQADHPGLIVRFLADARVFRLEYGEAHVAIRAGAAPDEPDNVVQPLLTEQFGLFASRGYLERKGYPQSDADLANHDFVANDDIATTRAPFFRWLYDTIGPDNVIFRATDDRVMREAVQAGVGLGFISMLQRDAVPDLVQVMPSRPEWQARLWIVTHVDLHRTTKVQAFLAALKEASKEWRSDATS
ncbi:DNA-binding transcriptional regulator, LysR family [Tranquillimonas rosea]|uniref:DNA-binding transcriptional regulator, LysR family n=1 Tax=Tranquillimonas rosea TaxID=641238 RepID=A0A1H9QZ44_9RHOB|nr:LysR family transcriptional regulator [Tranquillimonas rosea]SER65734.1 DNA-binding transcriptional regulator, LysR family [Tranquillimonas rosea]